jgi:hypothetical protein
MKLKLISAVIAASFLAGCSSSGSNDSNQPAPQEGVASVQVHQGDELAAAVIRGDHGDYNAMVVVDNEGTGVIRLNGTTYNVTNGDVTTQDDVAVGSIQAQEGGFIFHGTNGGEVKLTNVDGRLVVSDYQPPRPELPILPEHPIFDDHDFTITETKSGYIIQGKAGNSAFVGNDGKIYDTNTSEVIGSAHKIKSGVVLVNNEGQEVAMWSPTNGLTFVDRDEEIDRGIDPIDHPIFDDHDFTISENESGYLIEGKAGNSALVGNDGNIYDTNTGEVIGTAKKGNSEVVLMNGHGQHVATWSTTDGLTFVERDETIDQGVRPPIENFKSELSDKVRSLSQEQRQQIKQAIKDRAARS